MRSGARCGPGGGRAWGGGGASGMHGGRPDSRLLGVRGRAERTRNMWVMVVTSGMSQLSGWLKAYAFCRVEGRGVRCGARCGPGGGRAWGGGGASGVHGGRPDSRLGDQGARAERTVNM